MRDAHSDTKYSFSSKRAEMVDLIILVVHDVIASKDLHTSFTSLLLGEELLDDLRITSVY